MHGHVPVNDIVYCHARRFNVLNSKKLYRRVYIEAGVDVTCI